MKNVETRVITWWTPSASTRTKLNFKLPHLLSLLSLSPLCRFLCPMTPKGFLYLEYTIWSVQEAGGGLKVPPCLLHRLIYFIFLFLPSSDRSDPTPPVDWKTKNPETGFWSKRMTKCKMYINIFILFNFKPFKYYFS